MRCREQVYVGAVGYLYTQLSPDTGGPPLLGDFRSQVAGAGPQAGWSFTAGPARGRCQRTGLQGIRRPEPARGLERLADGLAVRGEAPSPRVNGMSAGFLHRYLDPSETLLEVLFGLIMALTLTAGARLLSERAGHRPAGLAAALVGCNVAWGIIDAAFYLLGARFNRNQRVQFVRKLQAVTDEIAGLRRSSARSSAWKASRRCARRIVPPSTDPCCRCCGMQAPPGAAS